MKTLLLLIVALFSQLSLANDWRHINKNLDGYNVRVSLTTSYSPATYGSQGGLHEGILYVDVNSQYPMNAQKVSFHELDGRKVSEFRLKEDHSTHFYGKKPQAETYGNFLWFGREYLMKIEVDGRVLEGKIRL